MFGSEILEVAIGLVFVYLVASIAATALREIIESFLKTRAIQLERGIRLLLDDPSGTRLTKDLYGHPLLYALFAGNYDPRRQLTAAWLSRGTAPAAPGQADDGTAQRLTFASNLPSYIPSRNFALALMDLVGGSATGGAPLSMESLKAGTMTLPDGRVKQAMMVALAEAQGDLTRARTSLEAWFDSTMDRVSGWYKRETQLILLVLGFLLAAVLNIDTVGIVHELATNNRLRADVVKQAEDLVNKQATAPATPAPASDSGTTPQTAAAPLPKLDDADIARIRNGLTGIIGWERFNKEFADALTKAEAVAKKASGTPPDPTPIWTKHILLAVVGWALTAVAVSLGGPFWFDVLNKLMVVRSTVKPYEKSPPEGSEDRRGSPPPADRLASAGGIPGGGSPGGGSPGTPQPTPPAPSGPPPATLRLAIDPASLDLASATMTVNGDPVPVPADGLIELSLDRDATHTVKVDGTRNGSQVSETITYTPRTDGDDHPLVV